MISNECNGCEYKCSLSHIAICTLGSPCPNQRSTPMTEQEYLQTCNTEQLAEFLACVEARQNADYNEETKAWVEWLKQPHTFE